MSLARLLAGNLAGLACGLLPAERPRTLDSGRGPWGGPRSADRLSWGGYTFQDILRVCQCVGELQEIGVQIASFCKVTFSLVCPVSRRAYLQGWHRVSWMQSR